MRHVAVFVAFGAVASFGIVSGCGSAAGDPSSGDAGLPAAPAPTPAPTPETPADAGTAAPTAPPADAGVDGCTDRVKHAGDFAWELDVGGRKRTANVHVPLAYDPSKRTPVVLNIHGYTDSAEGQASLSRMVETSDAAGFVLVHPQGFSNSWNAGACCGLAMTSGIDDVGFVAQLLDEVEAKLCVDPKRIYASGMSNGGFLAHRLGCELSDRIAAVGSVAGLMTMPSCSPPRGVPVMQFHGTADLVVPYGGNALLGFPAVTTVIDGWVERNACTGAPTTTFSQGDVVCTTRASCKDSAEVTLCTVDGGGHTWPGGTPAPTFGKTTTSISASQALWEFFARHPMP